MAAPAPQVNPALLRPLGGTVEAGPAAPAGPAPATAFGDVLRTRAASTVAFSQHALQRIQRRGIDVSPQTLHRLESGVTRAAGKGARDSVVFVNGTAFVVSVANKTVITAVDQAHMRDFVFTNIDSAVIA
jgi:flagellar operon protein